MIQYKGGNGSSKQESIIILGADNKAEGVDAEWDFLNAGLDISDNKNC